MPQHIHEIDTAPWVPYLGLPYRWGADPNRHGAADCLRLTIAVLAFYDAPRPMIKRAWYRAAGRGHWQPLLDELAAISRPVAGAMSLDVALLDGGEPIALAVCVAGGLLTTCQEHGAHWRPLAACQIRRWFCFLPPGPVFSPPNLIL